jgi:hypothetical protein
MLHRVANQKRTGGPLFKSSIGSIREILDLDTHLVELLDKVRAFYPTLIPKKSETSEYSLWRSGCRGATTEAMNLGIDRDTLDLLGCCTEPGLAMRQVYMQVRHVVGRMLVWE